MIKIFVDTNIFLHFIPLEQINWQKVVGTSPVTIVIPLIVLQELDKHKREGKKTSQRAKDVLKKVDEGTLSTPTASIELIGTPKPDVFAEFNLDKTEQDQVLLASILQYRRDNPNDTLRLLTDDTGMRVQARIVGVETIALSEGHRSPVVDESEKKIKQLEQEIVRLKNTFPDLRFTFENGLEYFEQKFGKPDFEKYKRLYLERVMADYSPLSEYDYRVKQNALSPADIALYNTQLEQYRSNYAGYLNATKDAYMQDVLSFFLSFKIENTGSAPATGVELYLKFPPFVTVNRVVDDHQPERMPYAPSIFHGGIRPGGVTSPRENRGLLRPLDVYIPGPSDPIIRNQRDGDEVTVEVQLLKHKDSFVTEEIVVTLHDYELASSFSIEYTLHANNILDKIEKTLHVKIERN